ncbi:MAG: response regulator, partial [Saprospirales bacterium]
TNELEVTFTILQFWYLRTWAILLWVFLIIGGVYWVVRYLFRRKLERQRMSQLEELDRQKTRLYTNITHEFRTPLTVILGLTEKAKEMANLLTNDSRKMFRTISHNGSQLLLLVNQMMDLAGVEYGKIQLDKKPVQIAPFIKHLCFSFESMASQKRIELYYEFSGSDKAIHLIDPQRLQQLISNLLTNAIKFSPAQSSIFIHASLKENQSGHTFSFKVRDNGPGIPSGEEEKVFDRFHRVDSDQTRHLPGSGIGLALAKELVELMNGSIRVENSSGGGAVFSFEIPLKNEVTETSVVKKENSYIDAEDLNIALASLKPHTGSHRVEKRKSFIRSTGEKPLILLVEDHPDVLSYIESCIPDQYQTATAVNGKEGVKLALEKIPDLIISDVMMPELDGYQLCDQLKQHRATSHIPILLLTAKSDDESRLAGLKHGADAYLAKPFNKEELLIRIGNMFKLIDRLKQMYSGSFEHPKKLESESSPEGQFLQQFYQTLEENYTLNTFGIEQMSDKMNLSRSQLYRKIKAITDDSPSAILKKLRLQKGRRLLFENPDMTIAEVAYSTGFSSGKYFSDAHLQQFGVRPKRVEARHIIKQDENE